MTNISVSATTTSSPFIKASEVASVLDVSRAYAYEIIKKLNNELTAKGYMTLNGRTNRRYFMEKFALEGEMVTQ